MFENFNKIKEIILEEIFPSEIKCIFCNREIHRGEIICEKCLNANILNDGPRCMYCDTPVNKGNIVCDQCKAKRKTCKRIVAPFIYDGNVRKSILKFKSDGAQYLAKFYVKYIAKRLEDEKIEYDIIIPVPSHKDSIRKRGYNPARVLADELSAITGKPVADVLCKVVKTKNQKYLNFEERQKNLENSITLMDSGAIKGKNVLIIDDIVTSGATLEECASLLYKASNIYGCSVARRG